MFVFCVIVEETASKLSMTLSVLEWLSKIFNDSRSIAWSLCDS